jgi:hypothetical protein
LRFTQSPFSIEFDLLSETGLAKTALTHYIIHDPIKQRPLYLVKDGISPIKFDGSVNIKNANQIKQILIKLS